MSGLQATAWRAFVEAPTHYIARPWLDDCLGGVADGATLEDVVGHPRFQRRLAHRLVERHGLVPPEALPTPAQEDAPWLTLPPHAGATLVRYCGAICHAMAFVREIRAPRVVALQQRFGESAYAAAVANRELAVASASSEDIETLEREVWRDGEACVLAWLALLTSEWVAWLRLGLADGLPQAAAADAIPQARSKGPGIVRRAAAIIAAEIKETEHARTAGGAGQGHSA
ncbi:hypothetical protein HOP51_09705 [Halomonas sp. MCCC 1A11036]|uniref:Uncharacterized protein n=1 Tax=Billgrantia zhangzhouensis TaxID=2733481 RepID=A0ABS9AF87_9GAMM|nr:hypothetical protein [Halomonas zhangzhouensis]MCE8020377.1 hypothetical protein [Halomonas zhangzhouensis]